LGVIKVIKKGEKPGHCVGCGKECETQSGTGVEILFLKLPGVPVGVLALFIKHIWLSII
jgi:hypothetical protein